MPDNEIRYCIECGTELPKRASYCSVCGTAQPDGAQQEQPPQQPAPQEPSDVELTESEKRQIRAASDSEALQQSIIERKRNAQQNSPKQETNLYSTPQLISFFGVLTAVVGGFMPWIEFSIGGFARTNATGAELAGGLLVLALAVLGGLITAVSTHGWESGASYAVFSLAIGVVSTGALHAFDEFIIQVYEQELTSNAEGVIGEIEQQIVRDGIAVQNGVYVSLLGGILMLAGTLVPEN